MTKTSKYAVATFFDCDTIEDWQSFPKIRISAEVTIEEGQVIQTNTKALKTAIEEAVKVNVLLDVKDKQEASLHHPPASEA